MHHNYALSAPAMLLGAALFFPIASHTAPDTNRIVPNDNISVAGTLKNGVLDVHLDARQGQWQPYGVSGPAITLRAFGEVGKPLQTPGPMLRVTVGTRIRASVTNSTNVTLVVHGLA